MWRLLLLLGVVAVYAGEEGSFCISISHSVLPLDQQLTVCIEATVPPGYSWDEKSIHRGLDLLDDVSGVFTLVNQSIEVIGERQVITCVLEPWRVGEAILCFLPARLIAADLPPIERYSSAYTVSVQPLASTLGSLELAGLLSVRDQPVLGLNSSNHLHQLEDSQEAWDRVEKRRSHRRWAIWAMSGVLAMGMTGYLAKRVRWTDRAYSYQDPQATALTALSILSHKQLPQKGECKEFYTELTAILRRFIEDYYLIRAAEQTTEEFLHEAALHPAFKPELRGLLREFLALADLVKFACHHPSQAQCAEALTGAHLFILSE